MKNYILKLKIFDFLFVSFIFYLLFFILVRTTHAQDFRNDYQVEYFLSENENGLNSKVKFTVTITNFRSDVYVKQFSIGFPKSFTIRDIRAFDDSGQLTPQVATSDSLTKITLEFSNPNTGRNSQGNFYLEFNQSNLFSVNGNIWEVIIPTIDGKKDSNYKILVHLPPDSDKKISIAKPRPDTVSGDTIIWNNPKTKTVYAVFGDTQYYKTELAYRIKNSQIVPVYTDVAFPPDTLWQKIYLDKINPTPDEIVIDADGNYLGRYFLKPREEKLILFSGTIAVYSKVRDELVEEVRSKFSSQQKYLLAKTKYWKISQENSIKEVSSSARNIYDFVIDKLTYDYDKINSDNKRLGAEAVLSTPERAVCMEFTDLFIAIARQKGVYAREIEGFGFSQDPRLRPLSLVSDILHSWPEYYDTASRLWIPLDPTWEDTSGIDYFSSFDLNHITFAIHGKDPEYPLPAGMYKIEDSRDVSIQATNIVPKEKQALTIEHSAFPSRINDNQTYQSKITLTNSGNSYFRNESIPINSTNLETNPTIFNLPPLAPYEKKTVTLAFKAKEKNKQSKGQININFPNNKINVHLDIVPFYYELATKLVVAIFIIVGTTYFIILIRKRRNFS